MFGPFQNIKLNRAIKPCVKRAETRDAHNQILIVFRVFHSVSKFSARDAVYLKFLSAAFKINSSCLAEFISLAFLFEKILCKFKINNGSAGTLFIIKFCNGMNKCRKTAYITSAHRRRGIA